MPDILQLTVFAIERDKRAGSVVSCYKYIMLRIYNVFWEKEVLDGTHAMVQGQSILSDLAQEF